MFADTLALSKIPPWLATASEVGSAVEMAKVHTMLDAREESKLEHRAVENPIDSESHTPACNRNEATVDKDEERTVVRPLGRGATKVHPGLEWAQWRP